jgi:hypothetical protein
MELLYERWVLLREMGDATTADISNVELTRTGNSLSYLFQADGKGYRIYFEGPTEWEVGLYSPHGQWEGTVTPAHKSYEIGLQVNGSYQLTGNNSKPTAIYGELFKAIRKLMEQENPDALSFRGAVEAQDVMYDRFYKTYLKPYFTRVGVRNYLRNDLYNKYKQENGNVWRALEYRDRLTRDDLDARIKSAKESRNREREGRRAEKVPKSQFKRGDILPNGEIYIGMGDYGDTWSVRNRGNFDSMAASFDRMYPGRS